MEEVVGNARRRTFDARCAQRTAGPKIGVDTSEANRRAANSCIVRSPRGMPKGRRVRRVSGGVARGRVPRPIRDPIGRHGLEFGSPGRKGQQRAAVDARDWRTKPCRAPLVLKPSARPLRDPRNVSPGTHMRGSAGTPSSSGRVVRSVPAPELKRLPSARNRKFLSPSDRNMPTAAAAAVIPKTIWNPTIW